MTKRCCCGRTLLRWLCGHPNISCSTGRINKMRARKHHAIRKSPVAWARPRPLRKPAGAGPPPIPWSARPQVWRGRRSRRRVAQPPHPGPPAPGARRVRPGSGGPRSRRPPAHCPGGEGASRRRGRKGPRGRPRPFPAEAWDAPSAAPTPRPQPPRQALAPRPHPSCPARRGPPERAQASGGRDQPVTPVLAAVMVPRARRRRWARRGAHPAGTRSLTSRAPSARATRPGPRLGARRAGARCCHPGAGPAGEGWGVGGQGFLLSAFFFFFFLIRVVFAAGSATRRAEGRNGRGGYAAVGGDREGRC